MGSEEATHEPTSTEPSVELEDDEEDRLRSASSLSRRSHRKTSTSISRRKSSTTSSRKTSNNDAEDDDGDEKLDDNGELQKSRHMSMSKRRSARKSKVLMFSEPVSEEVLAAAHYLRKVLAVFLITALVVDIAVLGLRGGSSSFIDWWDMIGTVAYVRGRHRSYTLRRTENQSSIVWIIFLLLDSFMLYEIAGKTTRTLMRKTPVFSSLAGLVKFTVIGFLPVHFFPGDHLFELVEHNDVHQLIVCAYWATTKTRSLFNQMDEAANEHHFTFVHSFALCVISCEIATVVSKFDKNLVLYSFEECIHRFPGGVRVWIASRTLMASLFASLFMCIAVRTLRVPPVWVAFITLTLFASFYRYGNGLLERTLERLLVHPLCDARKARLEDEPEEGASESEHSGVLWYTLLDCLSSEHKMAVLELEFRIRSFIDDLPTFYDELPDFANEHGHRIAESMSLVFGQLQRDAAADTQAAHCRMDEVFSEIETSTKSWQTEATEFGNAIQRRAKHLKLH